MLSYLSLMDQIKNEQQVGYEDREIDSPVIASMIPCLALRSVLESRHTLR